MCRWAASSAGSSASSAGWWASSSGSSAVVVGVVGVTAPVHATPLTVKAVGAGLEPVQEPLNPKLAVPLVAIAPL